MKNTCPVCNFSVEGVRKETTGPEGIYFNFKCPGKDGTMWTRMFPPIDSHDSYMASIQFSERVLVRLDDESQMYFARYSYSSDRWSVEGCVGTFKVAEWWPLPKEQGILVN